MRQFAVATLIAASSCAGAQGIAMDQPVASLDVMRGIIGYFGNNVNGSRVCLGTGESVGTVRPHVEAELQRVGVQGLPTPNQILAAMSARYPCPFAPYARPELRPAERADLEGTWLMPPGSMKLFLPPQSSAWQQERAAPLKCEVVRFLPNGDVRTLELRGAGVKCPEKAADFSVPAGMPRVVVWDMPASSRVVLTRHDIPGHVEEWEAYMVTMPFEFAGVSFQPGDMIEYARKHPQIAQSFAYRFRHLQRLQ